MGKAGDRFLSTLSMVSRIPIKTRFSFDPSRMDYWLPVTGVFPALLVLLLFACFSFFGTDPFAAAVVTLVAQYLCFNLFHLDGLMDTADAFLGTADREKRLSVLKDSRIGVYGFFAGFAALSLKTAFLRLVFAMGTPPHSGFFPGNFPLPLVFPAFPLFGRFSAALVPCMAKPASPGGLGAMAKDSRPARCIAGIITALACFGLCVFGWALLAAPLAAPLVAAVPGRSAAAGWFPLPGAVPPLLPAVLPPLVYIGLCLILISPLTALFYARLYRNSLGGYTGDA
ncbi:MAG: adenosylcobinamide-GDP ribazoletransferase, partial [Spirochaetaceae bacterium]|nr:adenosylcobinamide-GDP ribazoletransferase [Spirochaetaceae bacterium]